METPREMLIFCLLLAAISSPVFTGEWTANMPKTLEALVTSCVVVPCTFSHPHEKQRISRLKGIWHRSNECVYDEDDSQVSENFRGHTQLLGQLGQSNCTLEIDDIKDHYDGLFCFQIEFAQTETSSSATKRPFHPECVQLNIVYDPPKLVLTHQKTAIQDHPFTVSCRVTYTCRSHLPTLTWSRGAAHEVTEDHKELHIGSWEAISILTFIPGEKDDHSDITCTANFHGGKTSSATLTLYVKRTENYKHIIIPTAAGFGTALIFGVLCVFMVKKYKRRISELQSRDGSVWNRLSRLSRRIRSDGPGSSRSAQRVSDVTSKSRANQEFSKARLPSPKSQPKSNYKEDLDDDDDYINTADLNIYGNL